VLVSNGQEAIDYLSSKHEMEIKLVLMDCQMPVMDGFEASRQIRKGAAGEAYQFIPIIATTANALKGDDEKCLAAGMTDYTVKPVEPEQLMAKIQRWSKFSQA
jgi:CheY-like chemotaxis protein